MIPVKNAPRLLRHIVILYDLRKETKKWAKVLDCVVNITLTASNLVFASHKEKIGQPNSGNVLEIIDLLNIYDPLLQEIISCPKSSEKCVSQKIQNEVTQFLS